MGMSTRNGNHEARQGAPVFGPLVIAMKKGRLASKAALVIMRFVERAWI